MIFPLILRDAVFQNKLTPSHHSKASQKRHRKGSVASDISSSSNDRWSPSDRKKLKRSTLRDESSDSDEILITEDRTPLKSPRENTSLSNGFGDKSIESGINIDLPTKEQNLWFVCEVIRESINELLNAMLRTFWRVEGEVKSLSWVSGISRMKLFFPLLERWHLLFVLCLYDTKIVLQAWNDLSPLCWKWYPIDHILLEFKIQCARKMFTFWVSERV